MIDCNFVLLYVQSPAASAAFYGGLLDRPPVESSPLFAMFVMPSGVKLGLWARDNVEPKVTGHNGGGELIFPVADDEAVDRAHADWRGRGIAIAQAPTAMDFGRTFVGLDPDGHRLRIVAPVAS